MRVVIMAAGKGTRISRHFPNQVKCTLEVGGVTVIENTVQILQGRGIKDIAIVVGYESEYIVRLLKDKNVTFYHNPFFDVTNSSGSLWLARDFLEKNDDVIMLNGDVYFDEGLLDLVLAEKVSPVIFSDETRCKEGDYMLCYKDGILIDYGKDLDAERITGEYVGIIKMSKEFIPKFLNRLDDFMNRQKHDLWWENILYSFSEDAKVYVKDVQGVFWAEVDYIEDYQRILDYVASKGKTNEGK